MSQITSELHGAARLDRAQSSSALLADIVMRATAIMGLLGVAVIHFAQVVPTVKQTPYLGVAFLLLALACVAVSGQLLHRGSRLIWSEVVILNLLAIGGYTFTRMFSSFLDNQDVGNWSEMLGVAALFTEGVLVLLGAHALSGKPALGPAAQEATPDPRHVPLTEPMNSHHPSELERRYADVSGAFARTLARR